MITIQKFTFNPFQENTYVLFDETKEAVIIDPGCYEEEEWLVLKSFIEEEGLKVVHLLNTHCHIDHVLGNQRVSECFGLKPKSHKEEAFVLASVDNYAHLYGFANYLKSPDLEFINEGDEVQFGQSKLKIIYGPGHSPGHIAFYNPEQNFIISGDILFQGSFGRVDLPGGDFLTLKDTILNTMFALPEETIVYSGHGNETSIGIEKKTNPMNQL